MELSHKVLTRLIPSFIDILSHEAKSPWLDGEPC